VGALKIVHEKFRTKKKTEQEEFFRKTFESAVSMAPEMKGHIHKAQEDLNPLTVLRLLEAIPDAVKFPNLLNFVLFLFFFIFSFSSLTPITFFFLLLLQMSLDRIVNSWD